MEVTWVQDRTASDVALILKLVNCRNMVGSSLLGLHHMNNSSRGSLFYFYFFLSFKFTLVTHKTTWVFGWVIQSFHKSTNSKLCEWIRREGTMRNLDEFRVWTSLQRWRWTGWRSPIVQYVCVIMKLNYNPLGLLSLFIQLKAYMKMMSLNKT